MHDLYLVSSMYLAFGFLFTLFAVSELSHAEVYDPVRKYGFKVVLWILFWPILVMLMIQRLVSSGAYLGR